MAARGVTSMSIHSCAAAHQSHVSPGVARASAAWNGAMWNATVENMTWRRPYIGWRLRMSHAQLAVHVCAFYHEKVERHTAILMALSSDVVDVAHRHLVGGALLE
eukprot:365258-Chlamydomonas_euryale.AAC.6